MLQRLAFLLIPLILLTGCNKDDSPADDSNPITPASYVITFSDVPEILVAIEGATRSFDFIVSVTTSDGLYASGKTVSLGIAEGSGVVTPVQVITNPYGQARGNFSIEMPLGNSTTRLAADLEGYVGTADVRIAGLNRPAAIELTIDNPDTVAMAGANVVIAVRALITDQAGRAVSGVNLNFGLIPAAPDTTIFGSITVPQLTDANGETSVTFRSNGQFGRQKIFCAINEPDGYLSYIRQERVIEIKALNDIIGAFSMVAVPDWLSIGYDHPESCRVDITIRDLQNVGLENITTTLNADVGIVQGPAITNDQGRASVYYYIEEQELQDTTRVANIYATIPGTDWSSETRITLNLEAPDVPVLALMTDTDNIFADNGQTYATLTAVLRDHFNMPIVGQAIQFGSTHGVAQSPVTTDENGIAYSIFTDVGAPSTNELGDIVAAVITARIPDFRLEQSVRVTILPWEQVDRIELRTSANHLIVGSNDSISVTATCLRSNGTPIGSGTPVHFGVNLGRMIPSIALTANGVVSSNYFSQFAVGIDTIRAWVNQEPNQIIATTQIQVVSGIPGRMSASASPETLTVNDPINYSVITVQVSDIYDNPVQSGIEVQFQTTLGAIIPSNRTDEYGVVTAHLTPGDVAGAALVTATTEGEAGPIQAQTAVVLESSGPDAIDLIVDPTEIYVMDGGIPTECEIRATVRDIFGSPIQRPTYVGFELLSNHPDSAYDVLSEDRGFTENGTAFWDYHSSQAAGQRGVRAWTVNASFPEDTVEAFSAITVLPGPAADIEVNFNPMGWDAGGGAWGVEVWAIAHDLHLNPILDGTPVSFDVSPDVANVSQAVIGNENQAGLSFPGSAYSEMIYQSSNTFDFIEITANIQTAFGIVSNSIETELPLQNGTLILRADPANWNFAEGEETARIQIWAELRDGHRIAINNGIALFAKDAGDFLWHDFANDQFEVMQPPYRRLTGIVDEHNNERPGQATIFLEATEEDVFHDPEVNETSTEVRVRLEGYPNLEVEPVEIIFTRQQ